MSQANIIGDNQVTKKEPMNSIIGFLYLLIALGLYCTVQACLDFYKCFGLCNPPGYYLRTQPRQTQLVFFLVTVQVINFVELIPMYIGISVG